MHKMDTMSCGECFLLGRALQLTPCFICDKLLEIQYTENTVTEKVVLPNAHRDASADEPALKGSRREVGRKWLLSGAPRLNSQFRLRRDFPLLKRV